MDELSLENLPDAMSRRTDAEFLEIVTERAPDYRPEALMAPESEVRRRGFEGERT